MGRYFIRFSYLGTHYSGMQKNIIPATNVQMYDTDTIQGALECAFSTVPPKCTDWPKLTCCSRTDAGVHSLANAAHVDLKNKYNGIYNPEFTLRAVNRYLLKSKHQIRLLEFIPVRDDFHCRSLAKSRTYIYRLMRAKNENEHRVPIAEISKCFHLRSVTFDIEKVKEATKLFLGKRDFTTFSAKTHTDKQIRYVRNLDRLIIEKGQPLMPYDSLSQNFDFWNVVCTSRSFLYNQVRRMVGSLIALGIGKITERDIKIMLQVPGHHNWIPCISPVPGFGLYLANVEFDQEEIDKYSIKYKACPESAIVTPLDMQEEYAANI